MPELQPLAMTINLLGGLAPLRHEEDDSGIRAISLETDEYARRK